MIKVETRDGKTWFFKAGEAWQDDGEGWLDILAEDVDSTDDPEVLASFAVEHVVYVGRVEE